MATRVTIYDSRIDQLFAPGQDVWKFTAGLGTEHLSAAIMFAPARSGRLKAAHYPVPIMTPRGKRGWRYTIRNDAEHSAWVHEGTVGPIMANGSYLSVPMFRGSMYPRFRARSVAGQAANPWIERAWDYVNPF